MPTSRPFAYNTGATISGTVKIGDLSVGTPTLGFESTGLQWWNGPDEDLGYVIAQSVSSNTQPTPVSGVTASVGFFRSTGLTESSYINLAQIISQNQTFTTGNNAYLWLSGNGYWSSWNYTPQPSGTLRLLIIGDSSVNTVSQFISSGFTGQGITNFTISAVTAGLTYSGTSNMASSYDAILYYSNSSQYGTNALTNNLTTFVNAGGGLVTGTFIWNIRPANFNYQLTAFSAAGQSSSVQTWTASTSHPILSGVSSAITNSSYFINSLSSASGGSTIIARLTPSNIPYVGVNSTTYAGRIVSVNTFPPGMQTYPNMRALFARAVMWAANRI